MDEILYLWTSIWKNLNNRWNRQGEAINYFDRSISFGKLFNDIEVCAKALKANGVEKGDIVTICMPNTPEVLVTFYALNRIGAIANMVHPLSKKNAIKDFVNETDSKMLFMFDDSYNEVKEMILIFLKLLLYQQRILCLCLYLKFMV